MSYWEICLAVEGGRSTDGLLLDREALHQLPPLVANLPICLYSVGSGFGHPRGDDGSLSYQLDPGAIVGYVDGVAAPRHALCGIARIDHPDMTALLQRLERRGRLADAFGLSLFGRAVEAPRPDGQSALLFTELLSLDIVDVPRSGGQFIRSCEAAALPGAPIPELRAPISRSWRPRAQRRDRPAGGPYADGNLEDAVRSDAELIPFEEVP